MPDEDDIQVEAVNGLPEKPPAGERILWQGRPATWALARDSLGLYWVAGYFALLAVWRVGVSSADMGFGEALPLALPFLILGALACGLILAISWAQARGTVYTVTTARIAMRVGAALTVTVNLPFTRIASAELDLRRDGTGTIALRTVGETRLSYLILWPHVRPWRMKHTQPALRSIPDAERVAGIIAEAAETRISQPVIAPRTARPMAAE
jgi:hypothetical protein